MLRKKNFLTISVLLLRYSLILLKREVFSELARKCFKTTGKHNLVVRDSFCGEKQFLLIFVPFYCFVQKGLFTPNPNFPLAFLLFKLVEKSNIYEYF